MTSSDELVQSLSGPDPLSADVSEAEKALIRFALKLSRRPSTIGEADIEALREHGWDDRAIHDAVQVVAYFHYVNRVAEGLGVELEDRFLQARPEAESA